MVHFILLSDTWKMFNFNFVLLFILNVNTSKSKVMPKHIWNIGFSHKQEHED